MRSGRAGVLWAGIGGAVAAAVAIAGCGNNYRPVVTPITSSGPATQPSAYAVVVSAPSPITAGVVTIIDYAGDSIMAQVPIGPGPTAFTEVAVPNGWERSDPPSICARMTPNA